MTDTKKVFRWIPVFASIAIQMCLGTAYIWGVFQSHLIISPSTPDALFNWPPTHGTLAYALLLLFLTLGSTVGGKLVQKAYSPRIVIMTGGILLGLGFFIAMFTSQNTPWLLWLSYGVLGGVGMGFAYTTTIATCQKWFPDKKGMVTGIIVAALGFGGLIFTPIAEALIAQFGVLNTFAIFAAMFIFVSVVGSYFIKNPPDGYKPEGWNPPAANLKVSSGYNFRPSEALKTPQFYMITLALMTASAAGSMMIPMAKILGLQPESGLSTEAAVAGVMIIAACNSFGRLFWGSVSDRLGRKLTVMLLMLLTAAAISGVAFTSGFAMLAVIAVIGFSYGGLLGVFPALTADYWGTQHLAINYGMILIGFGVGAVASSYLVAFFSQTQNFAAAFMIAGSAAILGLIVMLFAKAPKATREATES